MAYIVARPVVGAGRHVSGPPYPLYVKQPIRQGGQRVSYRPVPVPLHRLGVGALAYPGKPSG
jgi:hypothetical protein